MKAPAIIVYDVFDDDRRARLRAALGPVADRFQQSGWLIPSGARADPAEIVQTLAVLLAPEDRLRVYTPCPGCARAARLLPAEQPLDLLPGPAWVAW